MIYIYLENVGESIVKTNELKSSVFLKERMISKVSSTQLRVFKEPVSVMRLRQV